VVAGRTFAASGAAAGVLVFGSALGTGALWNDTAALDGGSLRSGELSLLVGNATVQTAMYAFDELAGSDLRPGSWSQSPLTIKNGGSVDLDYRLEQTATTGPDALAAAMDLAVQRVVAAENCPTGVGAAAPTGTTTPLYTGPLVGAETAVPRTLGSSASEALCIRLTVQESAPLAAQGATLQVVFTFSAVTA
jgi:hypothetical protein